MATSREERMQQRLRGAQRHQVEDVSFGFVLPTEPDPPTEPAKSTRLPRSTPNTAVKRKRLEREAAEQAEQQETNPGQASAASRKRGSDPYDLPDDTSEERVTRRRRRTGPSSPIASSRLSVVQAADDAEDVESLPAPSASRSLTGPRAAAAVEEVTESPADAPGSGRRRAVRLSAAAASSAALQSAFASHPNDTIPSSSPLTRKSRASGQQGPTGPQTAEPRRRTTRLRDSGDLDELSPVSGPPAKKPAPGQSSLGPASARRRRRTEDTGTVQEADDEYAEPTSVRGAARRPGPGRPRRSSAIPKATMASQATDETAGPRRLGRRELVSPATQRQPKVRKDASGKVTKPLPKKVARRKAKARGDELPDRNFSVNVQRFSDLFGAGGDDEDADVLQMDIPFTKRNGVNSVDVLAQMCEEIIHSHQNILRRQISAAEDRAKRRELNTMLKALEAFQAELRTRMLEHTTALDTLHALDKRVRAAQKEKLHLREEILRIRAEREEVALRMDAVRIKHESDSQAVLRHLDLSTIMHDVDLAVEQGCAAPPLTAAEQKAAELANLELIIARIADQASSKSDVGGTLRQVKEFNGLLERAAAALESR